LPVMHSEDGVLLGGRSFGKSASVLEPRIIQNIWKYPDEETVLSSFRKMHIKDRAESCLSIINYNPFLSAFINRTRRDPHYEVTFKHNHLFHGISVGDDPLALSIQGKHPVCKYIEETQAYPLNAFKQWQSTADPKGCHELYCGVVDGRIDTPFHLLDTPPSVGRDKFKHRRYHIPRIYDPWWNEEMKADVTRNLGGTNADDYKQQVMAEWGAPSSSVWDTLSIYNCMKRDTLCKHLEYTRDTVDMFNELDLPEKPEGTTSIAIGMDTGFVEPSYIGVFARLSNRKWRLILVVELRDKVIYEVQTEVLDRIINFYNVDFVGVDSTTTPIITSMLKNPTGRYANRYYDEEKIIEISFNENVTFIINDIEKKQKTKLFATDFLRSMFRREMFELPLDEDIIAAFNSEKQVRVGEAVNIKTPDNIHITDMFRCFVVAYYKLHMEEFVGEQKISYFVMPEIAHTGLFRPESTKKGLTQRY